MLNKNVVNQIIPSEIKKITNENFGSIEINAFPAVLFDTTDLLKEVCDSQNIDYNEILINLGLIDNPNQNLTEEEKATLLKTGNSKFLLALFKTFLAEYDRIQRRPGPQLSKLISLISEASEVPIEVLEKTNTMTLLNLLMKFLTGAVTETQSSFL